MPRGEFSVDVPHFCGELIHVEVKYWYTHGTRVDPPDYDEDHVYQSDKEYDIGVCPKCGVDLFMDDLFQNNIKVASDKQYAISDYGQGDEIDPDPADFEPSGSYSPEWSDSDIDSDIDDLPF